MNSDSTSARSVASSACAWSDSALIRGAWTGKRRLCVRAELLDDGQLDVDRRLAGLREGDVLEGLGPDAEDDALAGGTRARAVERHAVLAEDDRVAVDRRLDEVHRRRADERGDEEVSRLGVEPLRRVDLQQPPVAHDGDPLPEGHRLDLVVGHVERGDAEPVVELRQRGAHPDPELRVEVRKRLVHQERLRLPRDRPAHRDALALAAGELRRPPVEQLAEPEQLRHLVHAALDLRLRRAANLQAVAEVLADGHVRVERVRLEDHRDVAVPRLQVGHVAAADRDAPVGRVLEPRHDAQERRLAAAGRADEDEELAVGDLERHVVECDDVPCEAFREIGQGNCRHRADGIAHHRERQG